MQKYKVTINGKTYEVELEKVDNNYVEEASEPAPSAKRIGDGGTLKAPIQGTVLKILATPGSKVAKGETVMIIEAMKLENEIVSDQDGVVKTILVNEKEIVNNGQDLMEFEG